MTPMDSTASDWVSETSFGKWFLSTDIWFQYVLAQAVADLKQLAGHNLPRSTKLLMDVGCGEGRALSLLQKTYTPEKIIAVDIDPQMLRRANKAAQQCACNIEVKRNSVTSLDVPDASIDIIFCHQLIHHVANQGDALRELYRVLAPGGVLLVSESCKAFIETWPVRWLFRHPPGVQQSGEGYLELIHSAGFEFSDADVRMSTPWWSLPDFGVTRKLGMRREPSPATELLVVARKA